MLQRGASLAWRSLGEAAVAGHDLEKFFLDAARSISFRSCQEGVSCQSSSGAGLDAAPQQTLARSDQTGSCSEAADKPGCQDQTTTSYHMPHGHSSHSWAATAPLSHSSHTRWYSSMSTTAIPPDAAASTAQTLTLNTTDSSPSSSVNDGADAPAAAAASVSQEQTQELSPAQLSLAISASGLEALKALIVLYQDSMDTQHVLKALSHVATLERRTPTTAPEHKLIPDIVAMLLSKVMELLPTLSPMDLCSVIMQLGRLEFFPGQEAMLQLVNPLMGNLGQIRLLRHIVELVWALARLGYHHPALFAEVSDLVLPKVDVFQAKMISRMAWSYAKVQHVDWALFNALARSAYSKLADFDPGNFSILMWAFMANRHSDEVFFDHVSDVAARKIGVFPARDIARMLLAFAHLKYFNDTFFTAAARQAVSVMSTMEPRHLSNIAWACSKRKFFDRELFNAISERSLEVLPDFQPQNLSNLVWAFANTPRDAYYNADAPTESERLARPIQELFNAAAQEAVKQISAFTPQHLSNTARSYASFGMDNPALFDAIRTQAQNLLQDFNTQNLSDLAWAFARTGKKDAELLGAIATVATSSPLVLQQASPHTLADMAWAFAYSELYDEMLFSQVAATCRDRVTSMAPNLVADLLWSFGVVQHVDKELIANMKEACFIKIEYLKRHPEYLGKVVWALSQLQHPDPVLLQALKEACPGIEDFLASQFSIQDHSTEDASASTTSTAAPAT